MELDKKLLRRGELADMVWRSSLRDVTDDLVRYANSHRDFIAAKIIQKVDADPEKDNLQDVCTLVIEEFHQIFSEFYRERATISDPPHRTKYWSMGKVVR